MQHLELKPLNISQVNKLILEKKPYTRPDSDLTNPTGNYQDEDLKTYKEKCSRFAEISKRYQEYNEQTFLTSKGKSLKDYENFIERISEGFFNLKHEETESAIPQNPVYIDGKRERRRLLRNIHETPDTSTENYCIEPWFKRYLVLNKFIHYSRLVILKNRLLKNLEKLKKMDKDSISELEKKHLKCKNVSYSELFAKFLYS